MIVAEGLGSILAICKPHYRVTTIKVPIQKCYYWHPPTSLQAPLQATLPANERAAAAFHDHLADDMAEIKTMLYGVIKEKMTINEQQALITEKKAYITHMLAEDD